MRVLKVTVKKFYYILDMHAIQIDLVVHICDMNMMKVSILPLILQVHYFKLPNFIIQAKMYCRSTIV